MNRLNDKAQSFGPVDDRRIDRLVDGELPDEERRALLLRLENEPDGWRRCAIAFLEAQSWRDAAGSLASPLPETICPAVEKCRSVTTSRRWQRAANLTALATGLAVAFLLGWAVHGRPDANTPRTSVTQVENLPAAIDAGAHPPVPTDLAAAESRTSELDKTPAELDSLVRYWELRGYRAERQRRLVSIELNDGRKVEVPVQEVRLQYVGGRTY
jgi:anti-sigma factor RsiW